MEPKIVENKEISTLVIVSKSLRVHAEESTSKGEALQGLVVDESVIANDELHILSDEVKSYMTEKGIDPLQLRVRLTYDAEAVRRWGVEQRNLLLLPYAPGKHGYKEAMEKSVKWPKVIPSEVFDVIDKRRKKIWILFALGSESAARRWRVAMRNELTEGKNAVARKKFETRITSCCVPTETRTGKKRYLTYSEIARIVATNILLLAASDNYYKWVNESKYDSLDDPDDEDQYVPYFPRKDEEKVGEHAVRSVLMTAATSDEMEKRLHEVKIGDQVANKNYVEQVRKLLRVGDPSGGNVESFEYRLRRKENQRLESKVKTYNYNPEALKFLKGQVNELLHRKLIERAVPNETNVYTPLLVVRKKDLAGKYTDMRLVQDCKLANVLLEDDRTPTPVIRD